MKKTKILFPLFLGIILISSFLYNPSVNATISYYNHLQNPSFIAYNNIVEDGSFESGMEEQGLIYGNWSGGTGEYSLVDFNTGIYSYLMDVEEVMYNLTISYYILGADIESFVLWAYGNEGAVRVDYYYEDTTTNFATFVTTILWAKYDFTGNVTTSKNLVAFKLSNTANTIYVDDVSLLVDDGGGQDDITPNSIPWYETDSLIDVADVGINSLVGRLDNTSGYVRNEYFLSQDITYLDSDNVHFVDGYFYSPIDELLFGIRLDYSDGTTSYSYKTVSDNTTFTYYNFGSSFIDTNKYITRLSFFVHEDYWGIASIHCDDVGLWADVEFGYKRFSYSLSPNPISISSYSFTAHQQAQYTMNCYLYDENGTLTEDGDFQVSDNTGFTTGEFENGTFSYILTARISTQNFEEQITITVILTEEIISFQISANWYYTGTTPEEYEETIDQTADFMTIFIFIVIPSMFLAVILKPVGIPIIGFLSGLTIMTSIGRIVGIVDLWFLFVMVLVVVLIILSMLKRGIYT